MDNWLDSWTRIRRLPCSRHADEIGHESAPPTIVPYEDSMFILRYGKKAWRKMKAETE